MFQAKKLAWVEEVGIQLIAPAMETVGFVAGKNGLLRHEQRRKRFPSALGLLVAGDVLGVGLLEKSALVTGLSGRIVILDREEAMTRRAGLGRG